MVSLRVRGSGLGRLPSSAAQTSAAVENTTVTRVHVLGAGHLAGAGGERPASYNFKLFTLDDAFIGTSHLIRADLYHGQPCPQTGGQYFFIAPIGY